MPRALLVDVTDRVDATARLLAKIDANMTKRRAAKTARKVGGTELVGYTLAADAEHPQPRHVFLFVKQQRLVAVTDQKEALDILARLDGNAKQVLGETGAYQYVMARCAEAAGELQPLVTWFVEPLGYAHAVRAAAGGRKQRGKDRLKILGDQGFDAIKGAGGYVTLATEKLEVLHHTFIYAPAIKQEGEAAQQKYQQAFRMFDFPDGSDLQPPAWIPRELATYVTFNWRMQEAFGYSQSLVDAFLGEGFFEDFFASLRDDIHGPQVDIRQELVTHLGQRVSFLSDNVLPITPESERLMLGLELKDVQAVADSVNRVFLDDPSARRLEVNGHTIWEILNEQEDEMPEVVIDGIGLTPLPGSDDDAPSAPSGGSWPIRRLPWPTAS